MPGWHPWKCPIEVSLAVLGGLAAGLIIGFVAGYLGKRERDIDLMVSLKARDIHGKREDESDRRDTQ